MKKEGKIKILYIDDEMNNLIGFKASFRLDYQVLIANNTTEALDHLNKHPDIQIVFCDQRMPDKTGVEFFEETRAQFPYPIRILLTGYTDIESVIDAINRGHIFRYVKKPWTDADIRSAINEASQFYTTTSMLALKNQELQRAYQELDKFAYSVTHDMRGPMLSILGSIQVMQYMDDISEIREMMGMLEETVRNLDTFIQNIHDYYNLKRGELQIEDIDFNEIVEEQKNIYKITIQLNGINFQTHIDQRQEFRSDRMSLVIILNNLLSNAFKYQKKDNPDKIVELDVSVHDGKAMIRISDNGIGIPEKYLGEVFNMFFRATSTAVGSGFGLYNVKDALNKLDGEITVDSIPGEKTVFTVTIPSK